MQLSGTSIVITGASTGIGEGLAVALAKKGARITLAARGAEALENVRRRIEASGGRAIAVPTDVGDAKQCEALIARAVEAYGGVDVLVNNAGISTWARFEEITDLGLFERIMRVNFLGAVYCTKHALPHLRRSKGLIVAVSSLTGKTGVPTRSAYAATKHAMQGFFDSIRIELRSAGVDVCVISPGFVATDIRARALGPDGAPMGESPREENRNTMSLERCVDICVDAIEHRRREVVMTPTARIGMFLKLLAPSFVDRIAERAVREKK